MPGDSAYVREHNTPTKAAVHARRPLLTARGVDLSMMLTDGPLTTPGLAARLCRPRCCAATGSQAATGVLTTQRLVESQGDERLVAGPLVRATPESPLVLVAPMLACLPEDAPTRDRLGRLP